MLHELSKNSEAEEHLECGLALAQEDGMRRFEVVLLYLKAWICIDQGHYEEGTQHAQQAMDIFQQSGDFFAGARVWGVLALLINDDGERQRHLVEGENLLKKRAHGINAFYFYRDAIEVCLRACAWNEALRYAALMEDYSRLEPLPWSDFFVARGRALALYGSGDKSASTFAELERLSAEAKQVELHRAIPALDALLRGRD